MARKMEIGRETEVATEMEMRKEMYRLGDRDS